MEQHTIITTNLVRVLRVFYMLGQRNKKYGTPSYRKVILMQLQLMRYFEMQGLPTHDMYVKNPGLFNEESGEISFSILSRCVMGDTMKHDHKHLNEQYCLMPVYLVCREDIARDLGDTTMRGCSHRVVKPNSPEVRQLEAHFLVSIRAMVTGTYVYYPSNKKANMGYESILKHHLHPCSDHISQICVQDVGGNDFIARIKLDHVTIGKEVLNKSWVGTYIHIWPEADGRLLDGWETDSDGMNEDAEDMKLDVQLGGNPDVLPDVEAKVDVDPNGPDPRLMIEAKDQAMEQDKGDEDEMAHWQQIADNLHEEDDELFVIKEILERRRGTRLRKNTKTTRANSEYLCTWVGHPGEQDWIPWKLIVDKAVVHDFEANLDKESAEESPNE